MQVGEERRAGAAGEIDEMDVDRRESNNGPAGDAPRTAEGAVAVRSMEGWVIMATNIHEEASEEDVQELFGEYGDIKNLQLPLDRRSGYLKATVYNLGYVFVEYPTVEEAEAAIRGVNGTQFLEQTVQVDFTFVRDPVTRGQRSGGRNRSRSPNAEHGRS
ncbi:MAG: hypothetical protein M1820_007893 [Bogoriella megaspora]|nr:MAG: hypothetical protein M1820_007893 [Bogoriella megaspora]